MRGCGRNYCPHCDEETIHRDHRRGYESASCLGQIVWREGPKNLSVMDLDLVSRKGMQDGTQLLRLVEQKQVGHKFEGPQERTLQLLDAMISHASLCKNATHLHVNPRSGVYVVRGEMGAATSIRRQTTFLGPQTIHQMSTGQMYEVDGHEAFFRFLDPEDRTRRIRGEH